MIDTFDMINIIDFINQYEDNRYDQSDRLTLQTSLTQVVNSLFEVSFISAKEEQELQELR